MQTPNTYLSIHRCDVVSIPKDYNNSKGRTWRYEVVGEIDTSNEDEAALWGVVNTEYESNYDWSDPEYDNEFDDWDDDEFDDQDVNTVVSETAFVAPGQERTSWWRGVADRFRL